MVFLVTYIDEAQSVSGDAPWVIELSIPCSLATECSEEPTRRIEDLEDKQNNKGNQYKNPII